MHDFKFKKGELHCEAVKVATIAKSVGTPFYLYSHNTLVDHFTKIQNAFAPVGPTICYAMKANDNLAVLKTLVDLGAGFDIVSIGEFKKENIKKQLDDESLYATDLSDHLVQNGVAFKDAHTIIGKLIQYKYRNFKNGKELRSMDDETLKTFHPALSAKVVKKIIDPEYSVKSKKSIKQNSSGSERSHSADILRLHH